jgi:hypothetical protein
MTRAVLTSPALCDHVRPGRDSSHNTPSSVPTARSTARLAASSLQHAPNCHASLLLPKRGPTLGHRRASNGPGRTHTRRNARRLVGCKRTEARDVAGRTHLVHCLETTND